MARSIDSICPAANDVCCNVEIWPWLPIRPSDVDSRAGDTSTLFYIRGAYQFQVLFRVVIAQYRGVRVPTAPVYGFTLPRVKQLSICVLFGLVACERRHLCLGLSTYGEMVWLRVFDPAVKLRLRSGGGQCRSRSPNRLLRSHSLS